MPVSPGAVPPGDPAAARRGLIPHPVLTIVHTPHRAET